MELGASSAVLEAVRHEAVASLARWPDQDSLVERYPGYFDSSRLGEFYARLERLMDGYWISAEVARDAAEAEPAGERRRVLVAVYRDPTTVA